MDQRRRNHGARLERVRASKQYANGVFNNPSGVGPGLQGNPLPLLGEFFFGGAERNPPGPLPLDRPHETWRRQAETGFRATWLGHSTVLLELDGRRVLTDPVFGARVSPIGLIGPRRFHPVPAELSELPPLDLVLLSHDHLDHLCRSTLKALPPPQVPIGPALRGGAPLERYGFAPERITDLDCHESIELAGLRLTATPAQHFSGRGLGDRNRTLWASWVIQ